MAQSDDDFWVSSSRRQELETNRRREAQTFAAGWRRNISLIVLLAGCAAAYFVFR
ncbi:hypothetical protein [Variovorax sp. KK3]|uniref:hypothetical protein n=1 Tax=Variovorax sp. KK3 TaxID=1855728 RepID=UPI0015C32D8D|nr:hypothetical protein [Variovorax sp. KK3]